MRLGLVSLVALLILATVAKGSAPFVSIQTTAPAGQAPLHVTFTANGEADSYHWDFGDGSAAEGATAEHTYAAGRWTTTLSARSAQGEPTTQTVSIAAYGLTLSGPNPARFAQRSVFRGAIVPAEVGLPVALVGPTGELAHTRTRADGSYALRTRPTMPGSYTATSERASSPPLALRIVPRLVTRLVGSGARGSRLLFTARLAPANAGALAVKVARGEDVLVDRTFTSRLSIKLDTQRLTRYVIRVEVAPNEGYAGTARVIHASVVLPRLLEGSRSSAVAQLGGLLRRLGYAVPGGQIFDARMLDAVYAFQKVHGLPRTGVVDARFWRALGAPSSPMPRYANPADHLEVNKGKQVLYVVRGARVVLILPISTAGVPGTYTPTGRFAIYRKVVGFDPSPLGTLYDPMYYAGGYAIHGNPSVPPYPASHGCVRVPMWLAAQLFATNPYGETVYVY
jgi:peptidoglycan hydrolase-like protein with peptidoglycan-binding domain